MKASTCAALFIAIGWPLTAPAAPSLAEGSIESISSGGKSSFYGRAISGDGSVVVGGSGSQAARWTQADGSVGLGTLPGRTYSSAAGVNADGSVVVGYSHGRRNQEAFRWTQAGGMVGLGWLSGDSYSYAEDVNADGSVIVGASSGRSSQAFRWTQANGMVGLGTLSGGSYSRASAVSADGRVVVGHSSGTRAEAFRWTQAGGMVGLGSLSEANPHSWAEDVSADGAVVVGTSTNAASRREAFRWTQAEGMAGLGSPPGTDDSFARAVSGDGNVVLGYAYGRREGRGDLGGGRTDWRWTQADGPQSIADWLTAAGVDVTGYDAIRGEDLSADGYTILGTAQTTNGHETIIARVTPPAAEVAAGVTTLPNLETSLMEANDITALGFSSMTMPMFGAHHRPLMMQEGLSDDSCAWLTSDFGYYDRDQDGTVMNQELGLCHDFLEGRVRAGVGGGYSQAQQDTAFGGDQTLRGGYGVVELNYRFQRAPIIASLVGLYGRWDAELERGYLNGAARDLSKGDTDVENTAVKVMLNWLDAARIGKVGISPRASFTISRSEADGYTERGGAFPARFDRQKATSRQLRVGVEAKRSFNEGDTQLTASLEGVQRFDDDASGVSGDVIGLFSFSLPEADVDNNWARFGVDLDHRFASGVLLSGSVFGSTPGEDPDVSGALSIKIPF